MTCAEARERMLDHQFQLLDFADAEAIERHLASCADCTRTRDGLAERSRILDAWQPEDPASDLAERTVAAAHREAGALPDAPGTGGEPGQAGTPGATSSCAPARLPAREGLFRRSLRWGLAAAVLLAVTMIGTHLYVEALDPNPQETIVLGETEMLTGAPASLRVLVRDHRSGLPVADAGVAVWLRRIAGAGGPDAEAPRVLGRYRTDASGSGEFRFEIPDLPSGDYRITVETESGLGTDRIERPVRLRRAFACFLSTDKPVYQPGQTLHLRVLALRLPGRAPVRGEEAQFTVEDARGNLVFKKAVPTSEFGIAAADFDLATEVNSGRWRVAVRVGDTRSDRTVTVRPYVLPRFRVDLAPDTPFARPDSVVTGRLEGRYFFGKPVAGGRATLEAWVAGEEQPFLTVTGNLDPDGVMPFEVRLPKVLAGLPRDRGDATVLLQASVVDGAGHREEGRVPIVVSSVDLRALVVPVQNAVVAGVENEYFVFAAYPDGTPVRAHTALWFRTGRTPLSGGEARGRTDEAGIARIRATPPAGANTVQVRLDDGRGHVAEALAALDVRAAESSFLAWTEQGLHRVGETLRLHLLRPEGKGPVYVDVAHEGRTVSTRVVELTNGRGLFEMDLPEDLAGTLELHAWTLRPNGEHARETRLVRVASDGALAVQLELDRETYRPGESARLRWQVLDSRGRPTPAALGVAAVDEAVFALAEKAPGLAETQEGIEADLMRPLVQIKYPWSPALLQRTPDAAAAILALASKPYEAVSPERRAQLERQAGDEEGYLDGEDAAGSELAVSRLRHAREHVNSYREKAVALTREKRNFDQFAGGVYRILGSVTFVLAALLATTYMGRRGNVIFGVVLLLLLCAGGFFLLMLTPLGMRFDGMAPGSVASAANRSHGPAGGRTQGGRIREHFPELAYWNPQIVTDAEGRAEVEIPLPDSITTWRVTQSAVARDGRMGTATTGLRVFQDFFVDLDLPLFLTQGDEVAIPVAIHNHLDRAQTVVLELEEFDGFELLDGDVRSVPMQAGEVGVTAFRMRATRFGTLSLRVSARGDAGLTDAVRRSVRVRPDGTERTFTSGGRLRREEEVVVDLPEDLIPGTGDLLVRLFPSRFSEVVQGLENIVRLPYG